MRKQEAMMAEEQIDDRVYLVVLNGEEQYSVWWADRELPAGWRAEGTTGSRAECLAHIDEVWTDMRPLSLRRHMEQQALEEQTAG
jgi:MbtH protein